MVILPQPITHIHTHPPYRQSLHLVLLIWLTLIRRRLSVSLVMVTAAMQGSVPWAAMTVIKSTPPNNAKMRALSILVHPVIVWINPVPIMLPTVNVVPKIVPQVRQHLVMEKLSDKRLVETVVKNVVMILVLQVILNQQCLNVTIQVRRNAVPFVIKRKIVIRVPGIMIVAEAGNIAKGRLVPKIHQNVRFIVTAIIFHIAVLLLLFVLLTEVFTETVIAQNHAELPDHQNRLFPNVRIRGVMLMLIVPVHIVIVMPDIQGAELPAVQIFVMGLRARRQIWNVSTSLMVIANVAVDGEIIQAVNVRKIMARSGFVALRKNEPGMEIMLLNVWHLVVLEKLTAFILNVKRKEEHLVVQVVILMVVDIMFAHILVLFRRSISLYEFFTV